MGENTSGDDAIEGETFEAEGVEVGPSLTWPAWRNPKSPLIPPHPAIYDADIPDSWTREDAEFALSRHLAVLPKWLIYEWEGRAVTITPSDSFPICSGAMFDSLVQAIDELPAEPYTKRLNVKGFEIIVGHRASRKRGLTSYTVSNVAHATHLVRAASQFAPDAVFNALAIVKHAHVPLHRDVTNDYSSHDAGASSPYISFPGTDVQMDNEDELIGTWLDYNRVFAFTSASAHKLHVPGSYRSLFPHPPVCSAAKA
eukprot:978288-Amphidinium_carterae.1